MALSDLILQKGRLLSVDLGLMDYGAALQIQNRLHELTVSGQISGAVIATQHPSVLTFGKNATSAHLLVSEQVLRERNVNTYRVERGGEITAHNPGQQVVYPILALSRDGGGDKLTPRGYVSKLEESVIALLSEYGLLAHTDQAYPGVWIETRKICAVGIRIKNHVTMHGIALNVNNDLGIFDLIVPCGIKNRGVTNLQTELAVNVDINLVYQRLLNILANKLNLILEQVGCQELLDNLVITPYDPT